MTDLSYTADDIKTFSGLAHFRARPSAYVGDRGTSGQRHCLWEIISNSVDELILKANGGPIWMGLLCDRQNGKYQFFVRDTGRGIPTQKLVAATTESGTSGKIASGAYLASGGQFGIGAKVAAALSTRYRIISANYLETKVGSLYLENGEIIDHHDTEMSIPAGVTTVVELDLAQFFTEGAEFMATGYLDLVGICRQLNIFNPCINFQFYVYDRLLPDEFWIDSTPDAIGIIDMFINKADKQVAYSTSDVADTTSYLFEMWRMTSPVVYATVISKDPRDAQDRLGFNINMYFTKKSTTGSSQYFITVNNVMLPDKTENSATVAYMKVFRERIATYLTDEKLVAFVREEYRFPTLLLAIGIRYNGAELSGVTKTSFKDNIFAKQFEEDLTVKFDEFGKEYWIRLTETIKPDIQLRYSQFYDAPVSKSEGRKVFVELNFPNNYHECRGGTGNDELFIVEGRSAGNIITTRDNRFQAIYETQGKPTNVATEQSQISANRKALLKNPLYMDLMRILNITPNTTDMSVARFKKIIIATDADPDGYHIATLHLHNFSILNPRIIESGMVYIANPPLYSMNLTPDNRIFLIDRAALEDARIKFAYTPTLSVRIRTPAGIIDYDENVYRDMWYLVDHLGKLFTQVAQQLDIPLLILERLIFAIENIYPRPNYDKIAEAFVSSDPANYVRVIPDPKGNSLIVSIGDKDYPIGLDAIKDTIITHLLPWVNKVHYRDLEFLVRSRHVGSALYQERPMTMMMLYTCMCSLAGRFKVSRYKGLGQMPTESCRDTIMNPATRSITQITSLGDVARNYSLLGKDSEARKVLLTGSSVLTSMFIRKQQFI